MIADFFNVSAHLEHSLLDLLKSAAHLIALLPLMESVFALLLNSLMKIQNSVKYAPTTESMMLT
jgi:hypothetical protein